MQVTVQGDTWRVSSTDICVAGLGWVGVGLTGVAEFRVWRADGIAVTTREALMPDFAKEFERPGWSRSTKAQSAARIGKRKQGGQGRKQKQRR